MKSGNLQRRIFAATFGLAAFAIPGAALAAEDDRVEQGFFGDLLKGTVCKVLIPATNGVTGGILGQVTSDGFGLCKKTDEEESAGGGTEPGAGGNSGNGPQAGGSAIPLAPGGTDDLGMKPALSVNFLKVAPDGGSVSVEPAGPGSVYGEGAGFAVIATNNAPGYLEVWSIDDAGATFIEGVVLAGPGTLVLPNTVEGYYRFDTQSREDYIQFRYYPCELTDEQGFAPEANQQVAELTGRAAVAAQQLSDRLPSCTFSANAIDTSTPQYPLFDASFEVEPEFNMETKSYIAVANGQRPLKTTIQLEHE